VEYLGLPRRAYSGTDSPLAAGEGGVAHALGAVGVVAGDDQAGTCDGSVTAVAVDAVAIFIGVAGAATGWIGIGIEVEDAAVFLGQASVPVIAHARGKRKRGSNLPLVLHVRAKLIGAVVAVALPCRKEVT